MTTWLCVPQHCLHDTTKLINCMTALVSAERPAHHSQQVPTFPAGQCHSKLMSCHSWAEFAWSQLGRISVTSVLRPHGSSLKPSTLLFQTSHKTCGWDISCSILYNPR